MRSGPRGPPPGSGRGNSDKDQATPTWKKPFGFHPLTAFADHGPEGSGVPLAIVLRPGNAGSSTAADHIEAARLSLAQLPAGQRKKVLFRADSGGGTHDFLTWLAKPGRRLQYPAGLTITVAIEDALLTIPAKAWTPAYDADGIQRPGAWVAELTGCWTCRPGRRACGSSPAGNGRTRARSCGSPTSTATGSPASPLAPRADSSPTSNSGTAAGPAARTGSGTPKDTGLRNLPLHGNAQIQIWCEIVALAGELLAWMAMLSPPGKSRRRNPDGSACACSPPPAGSSADSPESRHLHLPSVTHRADLRIRQNLRLADGLLHRSLYMH